jgi:hypothetical protein
MVTRAAVPAFKPGIRTQLYHPEGRHRSRIRMPVPARADEGIDAVVGGLGGGSKRQEGACEYYGAFGKAHGVQWGGKLRM